MNKITKFILHCASISFWNMTSKTFRARSATCGLDSWTVGVQSSSNSVKPSSKMKWGKEAAIYDFVLRLLQVFTPICSRQFWNISNNLRLYLYRRYKITTCLDNSNWSMTRLENAIKHDVAGVNRSGYGATIEFLRSKSIWRFCLPNILKYMSLLNSQRGQLSVR